jgi:hypothetical protein
VPDEIKRIDYFTVTVSDKPGEAARLLAALEQAGVNLTAFSGFPQGARKSQLDFMPEDPAAFKKALKKAGVSISEKKTGFLIQGADHPGAGAAVANALAAAGINITSMQLVCAGAGRFGGLFWVSAAQVRDAEKALGMRKAPRKAASATA